MSWIQIRVAVSAALLAVIAIVVSQPIAAREAAREPELRAFLNDSCIVADEPYLLPTEAEQSTRAAALVMLVVSKLAEALISHAVRSEAGRILDKGSRKDTRYAVTNQTPLYRAELDPAPTLALNTGLGCMTVVAGRFAATGTQCMDQYQPKLLTREMSRQPEVTWQTTRTDDSAGNPLRRANICLEGEPLAVFEARIEFSADGTAYRLTSAGYRIEKLLGSSDAKATRSLFYTVEIAQPAASAKAEPLSTAVMNLGRVRAGTRNGGADAGQETPWLKVPPLAVEARRRYETQTAVYQSLAAEMQALERAIARNQRVTASLELRLKSVAPELRAGLRQEKLKGEVTTIAQQAELEARRAEYRDLPRPQLQFMPVSIEVGVTETASEKRALLLLAQVMKDSSADIAGVTTGGLLTMARSIDAAPARLMPDAELAAARSEYFDALVAARAAPPEPDATRALASARERYDRTLRANGLPVLP